MTVLRRVVTVPVVTALMVCVLVLGPLLLAVAALAGLAARSSRPVRTVALAMAYAFIELRTLVQLAIGDLDGDRLMRDFLTAAYAAVRRILDVEVVLDPSSTTPEQIPHHEPVIVLSRHCGPGDTVLVAWLLTIEYRLRVRVVLKAVLRCEPVLDFAGSWAACASLPEARRARRQIHDLAASLAGGQALLLFPEGANFTWPRWHAAIAELRSTGRIRAGEPRVATVPYAAPTHRRCHRRGDRSTERQCPCAHPQRLLPGRAGTALVAASDPPETARPHGSGPGRPTSPARSADTVAGTNLDPGRRLGRRPHRPWIGCASSLSASSTRLSLTVSLLARASSLSASSTRPRP